MIYKNIQDLSVHLRFPIYKNIQKPFCTFTIYDLQKYTEPFCTFTISIHLWSTKIYRTFLYIGYIQKPFCTFMIYKIYRTFLYININILYSEQVTGPFLPAVDAHSFIENPEIEINHTWCNWWESGILKRNHSTHFFNNI